MQYDLEAFFDDAEMQQFAPSQAAPNAPKAGSQTPQAGRTPHRYSQQLANVYPMAAPSSQGLYGLGQVGANSEFTTSLNMPQDESEFSAGNYSIFGDTNGQRPPQNFSSFTPDMGDAGMSTFGPQGGNAFTQYMRRLPSISYGARGPLGSSFNLHGSTAPSATSAFQGAGTQMGMSVVTAGSVAQGTVRDSQVYLPSMLNISGISAESQSTRRAAPPSMVESSGKQGAGLESQASFGAAGLSSKSDDSTADMKPPRTKRLSATQEGQRGPTGQRRSTGSIASRDVPATRPAARSSTVSPEQTKFAAGTLTSAKPSRGARLFTPLAPTDSVNVAAEMRSLAEFESDSDEENEQRVYVLRKRRSSNAHDRLFQPLASDARGAERESVKDGLVRARRMGPVVWERLLKDPTAKSKGRRKSHLIHYEGDSDEDEDNDNDKARDPDQWNGLPVRRRSLNNLLADGPRPARQPRPVDSDDEAKASGPRRRSEMQMDGTAPAYFINFVPSHAVPSPQPNLSGPKCASFVPASKGFAASTFRWALEEAPWVDSPRQDGLSDD